jgi:hypothetical protein
MARTRQGRAEAADGEGTARDGQGREEVRRTRRTEQTHGTRIGETAGTPNGEEDVQPDRPGQSPHCRTETGPDPGTAQAFPDCAGSEGGSRPCGLPGSRSAVRGLQTGRAEQQKTTGPSRKTWPRFRSPGPGSRGVCRGACDPSGSMPPPGPPGARHRVRTSPAGARETDVDQGRHLKTF